MKKPITIRQMLVLNAYWVGLSFMWNSLHPIILPAVLLNYVPNALKNTYLGLLTFAGLFIAMLIQPLSGALSDSWASRFGRRRPLIVIGTLFDFIFLILLAYGGGLLWLFIGYIGLQFSSNIAHGPLQGLLPDRVPKESGRRRLVAQDLHGHVQPHHRLPGCRSPARPSNPQPCDYHARVNCAAGNISLHHHLLHP